MAIQTFKRSEIKYIITKQQFKEICEVLLNHMDFDPHCKDNKSYKIYNLYFDTQDDLLIRKSLAKPYYKEKLRLRSYHLPIEENENVFLEIKKKIGKTVSKRRAILPYNKALILATKGITPNMDNYKDVQVAKEIATLAKQYSLTAKTYIEYERIAFAGMQDKNLRVSFDFNIKARRSNVTFLKNGVTNNILPADKMVMEIKCDNSIPMWLTSLLSSKQIYKASFSKYGQEYKQYLQSKEQTVC